MIRHILLVKVGSGDSAIRLEAAFDRIAAVVARLNGALAVSFGPSRSPENLERGYTHGLVIDFIGPDALLAYAQDPDHRAAGADIAAAADGGAEGLLVVDLVIVGAAS